MTSSRPVMMWFEAAPPMHLWRSIIPRMKYDTLQEEAVALVETIKEAGNEDLRKGSHYEALWKYNHAVEVCKDCGLVSEMATIQGNCAQACLNMGLYVQAYEHAQNHVELNPDSPKAYYRRAEAVRRAAGAQEILELEAPMVPGLPFTCAIPGAITDYWKCHQIEQNSKALCEAIILAVDFQLTDLLKDISISSDICPKLFSELVRKQNVKQEYIRFLISRQQFDASGIELSILLHSTVLDRALMERMFELGMTVKESNIQEAVETLCERDEHIMEGILSKYGNNDPRSLDQPCREALNAKKHKLASCLKKHGAVPEGPKDDVDKAREKGNEYFKNKKYDHALAKYKDALELCQKHGLGDERALVHCNLAQVCLKLHLYKDAYGHSTECIQLNPNLEKGYYRRAEALNHLLSNPGLNADVPKGKSFADAISDYCHCHAMKPSLTAFCDAIIVAVNHECTDLLPLLQEVDFNTKLLHELLSRQDAAEKHLQCLVLDLPKRSPMPLVNADGVKLAAVLKLGITDETLLERLFQMNMRVIKDDIEAAVRLLPDERMGILELILSKCDIRHCINNLCQTAMEHSKIKFTTHFIGNGAKPPQDQLKSLIGWPREDIDPILAQYLSSTPPKQPEACAADILPTISSKSSNPKFFPACPQVHNISLQEQFEKGQRSFKNRKYNVALRIYLSLLDLCSSNVQLWELLPVLHGNCALVYLEMKAYEQAYTHASKQAVLDPSFELGFYRRAEALKRALCSSQWRSKVPPELTFANVVTDLCMCHRIKPDVEALSEAIIIAVDNKITSDLPDGVASGFSVQLFNELLSREDTKTKHLKFIVFEMMPIFNASSIVLSQLLRKSIVSKKFLRKMFELGMVANDEDVKVAVETLPDTRLDTLELIISKWSKAADAFDHLLLSAMKRKKINFAASLIKHGAKTTDELAAVLLTQAIDQKDFHTAKVFLEASGNITFGKFNVKKTMVEVLKAKLPITNKVDLVCLLLMKGADCNLLSLVRTHPTTPLHVATELALEADGDKKIIDTVVASPTFHPPLDGRVVDYRGQTPLHLAVKAETKRDISCAVLNALTEKDCINPSIKDRIKSKQAVDYLAKNDERCIVLRRAEERFCLKTPSLGGKKKTRKRNKKGVTNTKPTSCTEATHYSNDVLTGSAVPKIQAQEEASSVLENIPQVPDQESASLPPTTQKQPKSGQDKLSVNAKLELQLGRISKQGLYYFQGDVKSKPKNDGSLLVDVKEKPSQKEATSNQETSVVSVGPPQEIESPQDQPGDFFETGEMNDLFSKYGIEDFDKLPWEVEVTKRVIKFFKDEKKNPRTLRFSAVRAICSLAEGRRSEKLSKQVGSEPKLQLYEAKISKASRILWQKAISFSPRQTGSQSHHIYTQVIRIWEIVVDHDQLNHYIDQIKLAHKRGSLASQCLPLSLQKGDNAVNTEPVRGRETIDLPMTFLLTDSTSNDQFVPAASMKEDEYNVTTFYSFSTALVKSVLTGENMRRDFPFKEWPKEHDIICLKNNESILLLGRSGTGKTTCCLYRLWNEFSTYWDPERRHPDARIPRKALVSLLPADVEEETAEDNGSVDMLSQPSDPPNSVVSASIDPPQTAQAHEQVTSYHLQTPAETRVRDDHDAGSHCDNSSRANEGSASAIEDTQPVSEEVLEDLHPVFITKNYVLCSQMKKRFYDMMASHDFLAKHMEFETAKPPNTLMGMDDHAFPLFLTAREFYILLDNSLEDEDEDKFFLRDSEGNPRAKIVSSDYDHEDPDTLLDLEESDSENEDDEQGIEATTLQPNTSSKPKEKWVEVTSLYFKEIVWPSISHKCNLKDIDPLLVWMEIQSFIKGSESALRKGGPLSLEEYRNVGGKLAPNFSDYRREIYDIYNQYKTYCQKKRHSTLLFDECDLVQDLHTRMHKLHDVPWSVHCFYIDEVQDFTQAELALFLQCCRDPNSTFFTGDTAQSIMRGISFRFQDLRSLFHRINKKVPQVKVPCKPHTLTVNFRSHSGIMGLAQSVLDLLCEFFPSSIDALPEDKGMFPGPIPVLLESCDIADLAFLLSTNRREKSAIEFGAHQVILVQSKKAKDNLPSILKGAIVLTIFESKGLEFDDVLLYNFFTDSVVDEKGWRVTTTYFEGHEAAVQNATRLPGSKDDPRGVTFNEGRHKSLNAELKYLYTAVTRAKCNLWIYDSDKKRRLPVFDYWHKRGLVKVVGTEQGQGKHSLIFASISTGEQWKVQGDYFMKKHLWEQAMHCYQKAGADCAHLVKEAEAYFLWHQARHSRPEMYLRAALCFLECDQLSHDTRLLIAGAVCLMNARHVRHYVNAAKIFESLGKNDRAFKAYKKAREFESCARLREKEGRFNDAVRILDQANKKREALSKAAEYEQRDIQLEQELSTNELSYKYAKRYLRLKDTSGESESLLLEMLAYMNDIPRKIRFLKEGGMFKEAFDTYVKQKQHREAYRLASAQGWFDRGKSLARQQKDHKMEAQFILQQIKAEWNRPDQHFQIREELHSLIKSTDDRIKAFAFLLLGKLEKDIGLCERARGTYKFHRNKVGEIEAFYAIAHVDESERKESIQSVLHACHTAQDAGKMLRLDPDKNPSAKQVQLLAAEFYGLQKIGDVYYMALHQNIWLEKLLERCVCEDGKTDLDGMLKLSVLNTREEIADRCNSFVSKWVQDYQLHQQLERELKSFKLHKEISENRFLYRAFSRAEVPPGTLKDYIQNCIHFFELSQLDPRVPCMDKINLLLSIFSPQVSVYLPLSKMHIKPIRESKAAKSALQGWIEQTVQNLEKDMWQIDLWLGGWRACCIAGEDTLSSILKAQLEEWAKKVSQNATTHDQPPPGFVFWRNENRYYHYFSFWLRSCELIGKDQALLASKWVIYHFLCNIAEIRGDNMSVMNFVDVLSVYCTAVMAMLAHLDRGSSYCQFQVPMLYQHSVQVFNDLNVSSRGVWLFTACAREVERTHGNKAAADRLRSQCLKILWTALDLLLGKRVRGFSLLSYAMNHKGYLTTGESRHCLILALTLFGNLVVTQSNTLPIMTDYQDRFSNILEKSFTSQDASKHTYIEDALKSFRSPSFIYNTDEVFSLLHRLLRNSDHNAALANLRVQRDGTVDFCELRPTRRKMKQLQQLQAPPQPSSSLYSEPTGGAISPQATMPSSKDLQDSSYSQFIPGGVDIQPVPSHPHRAVLSSQAQPLSQTVSPTSSGENMHMPAEDADLFYLQTANTDFQSQTELEIPSSAEVGVTYQRQTSETEFMRMESDPGDFLEPETQPELAKKTQVDTSEQEAVDSDFCSACGVGLQLATPVDQEESEAPLETEVDDTIETYDFHVSSEAHKRKVTVYKQFKSDRSWHYNSLKEELSGMLKKCQSVSDASLLDRIIDKITEVIEESEKEIERLQDAAEWQEGIEKISEISDQMNALLVQSEKEYTKVVNTHPTEQTTEVKEEDTEIQESDHEELEDDPVELRTPEEKARSRRKKKQKKKIATFDL